MQRIILLVLGALLGCAARSPAPPIQHASTSLLSESFEDPAQVARLWRVELPTTEGVKVHVERSDGNSVMALVLPMNWSAQELIVRRSVDLTTVRSQRVRLSAKVRLPKPAGESASVRLSVSSPTGAETYFDFDDSRPASGDAWTTVQAVVDVSSTAGHGMVELRLAGMGTAWFDDVRVTSLGRSPASRPTALSAELSERLVTLTRVLGLIRYFHPSDQSANTDWDTFSVHAVDSVLRTRLDVPMQASLERLFASVAPTARFVKHGDSAKPSLPRDPQATHLVRWHHTGLGLGFRPPGSLFRSLRDGIYVDGDYVHTEVYSTIKTPNLATCRTAEVRATVRATNGPAWVIATLYQGADRVNYIRQSIPLTLKQEVVIARGEVPADVQQVRLSVYLEGQASAEISDISLRCANNDAAKVDARSTWEISRYQTLYHKEVTTCGHGACLAARRTRPETEVQIDRDFADLDIGSGLRMVLPLAVWSDGKSTFPRAPVQEMPLLDATVADLPVRLAGVATIWNTLQWFYPYFGDQRIDWAAMLPRALGEAAAASSPAETHAVLSRLLAALQDGHGRVRHPTQSMLGMLPIALRKIENKILVVGGLPEYRASVPPGSEVLAVDGVPVHEKYATNYERLSASTTQFREYLAALYLSIGRIGAFRSVRFRAPSGAESDVVLPLVSRQQFDEDITIPHPRSGTEIAPSIFYVDPTKLGSTTLPSLITSMIRARAVILDLRGYITDDAFAFLAHFISKTIPSPIFRVPVVAVRPSGVYQDEGWMLWPASPHLRCQLIVLTDARALSAAETLLQMIRDNRLGIFIGEPTAGTNGNVNDFVAPGGFEVRFTGLRTSGPDHSTIQGHGIVPDQVVHPTVAGIVAGRDEILEAAIATAQRLPAR
jgi:hypothetical protein